MRPEDAREPADRPNPDAEAMASRLDRVWEVTRPVDPSPETLEALWGLATAELDRIESARRSGQPSRGAQVIPIGGRSRRGILAWAALAQAAVILIGVGITLARRSSDPSTPMPDSPLTSTTGANSLAPGSRVEVGFDEIVVVRIGEGEHRVDTLADSLMSPSMSLGTSHDVFNALESMATP